MNSSHDSIQELDRLLELLCESRISSDELERLEQIVLSDPRAQKRYLQYVDLHGTLYWDTAKGGAAVTVETSKSIPSTSQSEQSVSEKLRQSRRNIRRKRRLMISVLTACLMLTYGIYSFDGLQLFQQNQEPQLAENLDLPGSSSNELVNRRDPVPITLKSPVASPSRENRELRAGVDSSSTPDRSSEETEPLTSAELVVFIDERLREGWSEETIESSSVADDSEWVRRVYLDIVGHIPSGRDVESFMHDQNPRKRGQLIDQLIAHPDYVRNWTTVWTNLLIGRSSSRNVDRVALQKYLREGFSNNRPWNEMVVDLVSAEGAADESGASNFLLAHLNNQAVPATAIVSRLFLGTQVQCTQCHDHPFNEWKQNQFWEFNSFFKQTKAVRENRVDPDSGETVVKTVLKNLPHGGETYFENRRGVMDVAYPRFQGVRVESSPETNLRRELAGLMVSGENPQTAQAIVNRMWAHFFGYGFTRPIDDMSPHNPPSHPELMDRLSREFVRSGYDLKQLIRWICNSRAYQISSQFNETNQFDDPEKGNPPLFSRMYVKPMTAEQLYDSLLVATKADRVGQSDWSGVSIKRQQWLQQFVIAFQTEENDEASTFEGTVPQALLMMNSQLVDDAVGNQRGTSFHEILRDSKNENEAVRQLCLATLSRYPTDAEMNTVRRILRERTLKSRNRQAVRVEVMQDIFWAYLNSNEFILVH